MPDTGNPTCFGGPSTVLDFRGISLDTVLMEARLPVEKLEGTKGVVREWLPKKCATKRDILSLVGILQHATKVVRPGQSFLSRMYNTAIRVRELHHYTRINHEFRSDLAWWHLFLEDWNGISFFQVAGHLQTPSATVQTDASGNWGGWVILRGAGLAGNCPWNGARYPLWQKS